jgi:hypothetical protein
MKAKEGQRIIFRSRFALNCSLNEKTAKIKRLSEGIYKDGEVDGCLLEFESGQIIDARTDECHPIPPPA